MPAPRQLSCSSSPTARPCPATSQGLGPERLLQECGRGLPLHRPALVRARCGFAARLALSPDLICLASLRPAPTPPPPRPCCRAAFTIGALAPVVAGGEDPSDCGGPAYNATALSGAPRDALACHAPSFAGPADAKWADMWRYWGSCAGFPTQADYFAFSVAAVHKYDLDVSGTGGQRGVQRGLVHPKGLE